MAASKFRLALIQLAVSADKKANLKRALSFVAEAASKKCQLIALPECFNSPYGNAYFPQYAEDIPGESTNVLSEAAKQHQVYLIGGSIPERDGDKLYNTCTVWGPDGSLVAKHRKVHLFDIDIPGRITVKESDSMSPGDSLTMFTTPFCTVGIGICYDLRFPEFSQIYAQKGCELLVFPGAFNMTTGPAHWELIQRGRAVDNQLYVAAVSPARDETANYVAWGHSSVVNPWGEVCATTEHKEDIVYSDIDLQYMKEVRQQIPVRIQRRKDLYDIIQK